MPMHTTKYATAHCGTSMTTCFAHNQTTCFAHNPRVGRAGQKFLSASALCQCSCVQARLFCAKKNVRESQRVMFMKNLSQNIRKHSFRMACDMLCHSRQRNEKCVEGATERSHVKHCHQGMLRFVKNSFSDALHPPAQLIELLHRFMDDSNNMA